VGLVAARLYYTEFRGCSGSPRGEFSAVIPGARYGRQSPEVTGAFFSSRICFTFFGGIINETKKDYISVARTNYDIVTPGNHSADACIGSPGTGPVQAGTARGLLFM